jgi:protein-glutamine gamma-glutamyltransferase
LFRVAPNPDKGSNHLSVNLPLYIREAIYNHYSLGTWSAVNPNFVSKNSGLNKRQWILGTQTPNTTSVRISAALPEGISVLKLPIGTSKIDHPAIDAMQINQYGSVMVQGTPGKSSYIVEFDPSQSLDSPPTQMDLDIPVIERPSIQKILDALKLKGQSQNEAVRLVSEFFKKNFEYSLELPKVQKNSTPLSNFLLDHRSGHCEYFASATSLLLRSVGIPTRYAVGYSVHEYSPSEKEYVVRARNAHAWVMAYVNGSWVTVDTTPAFRQPQSSQNGNIQKAREGGLSQDNNLDLKSEKLTPQNANAKKSIDQNKNFEDIQTFIAKISDQWKSKSAQLTKNLAPMTWSGVMIVLGLAIIFASVFLAWWVSRRHFSRRSNGLNRSTIRLSRQSKHDDLALAFSRIEKRLTEWGVERKSSETVRQWIVRLKHKLPESKMNHLNEIIDLHYRYRFDPQGIEQEDCAKLRLMIQSWLMETAT